MMDVMDNLLHPERFKSGVSKPQLAFCVGAMGIGKTSFMHSLVGELRRRGQQCPDAMRRALENPLELRVTFGNDTPFESSDRDKARCALVVRMLVRYLIPMGSLADSTLGDHAGSLIRSLESKLERIPSDDLFDTVFGALLDHAAEKTGKPVTSVFLFIDEMQMVLDQAAATAHLRRKSFIHILGVIYGKIYVRRSLSCL